MVFPTVEFAIFFPIVLALSWALMSRQWAWKPFILAASCVFYSAANPKFCLLLGGLTLANQFCARLIHGSDDERRRKQIVVAAVVIDLGTLGIFKYYGFFAEEINATLERVQLGPPLPPAGIPMRAGVRFIV